MRRWWAWWMVGLMLCFAAGCGGGGEKGQNRDKDKPVQGNTTMDK